MGLKTIVVHVDEGLSAGTRMDAAVALATEHDAHLIGIHSPGGDVLPSYFGNVVAAAQQVMVEEGARKAEAVFRERMDRAGRAGEWVSVDGDTVTAVARVARVADLVVASQGVPGERILGTSADLAQKLVFAAGRPVLVVPHAWSAGPVGRCVLVAWSGTREAARAVGDAMPVLARAERVIILSVSAKATPPEAGPEIMQHLARHGLAASYVAAEAEDMKVGDAVLARAAEEGADMIVMGAYGHSRLRDQVLGGVTQTVLRNMAVPVLMSH